MQKYYWYILRVTVMHRWNYLHLKKGQYDLKNVHAFVSRDSMTADIMQIK